MKIWMHSFLRFFSSSVSLHYFLTAVLLTLSFPRFDHSFLVWIALVPLMFSLESKGRRESFRIGYFCGVLFFGATLFWLGFVTRLGTVLFIAYLSLYFGLFSLGYRYFSGQKVLTRLFFVPALWVALEYTRAHFLTGFGWVCLGHSQYKNLWIAQVADIVGVYGISFLVVMVNVLAQEMAACFIRKRKFSKSAWIAAAIVFVLLGTSIGYGLSRIRYYTRLKENPQARITIGVAQGNVPHERRWSPKTWPFILEDYDRLSQKLAAQGADLIVWPESAYPGYCWEDPQLFGKLQEMVRRQKTAHLIGVVTQENEKYFNSALAFDEDGQVVARYHKLRLVPFGEFIPFRRQVPFLSAIVPIDDFAPGHEFTLFSPSRKKGLQEHFYSVLICFEDTLPDITRGSVQRGAQLLINISNDAWFEDTNEPFLHLQNAVFRSIENRRWLARCGNVGVSCFVSP